MKVFYLEGNIAAGKSVDGERWAESPRIDFIEEPVATWQSGFDKNLLNLYYKDPHKWALPFQFLAFFTRIRTTWDIASKSEFVVIERSIFSDKYVFARAAYVNGYMMRVEWQLYNLMWDWHVAHACLRPHGFIYLYTPAKECYRRLEERGRIEEGGVGLPYLEQLELYHNQWLDDNPLTIKLDGTGDWPPERILPILEQA